MKIHPGIREIITIKVVTKWWWRFGGGVMEVAFWFGGVLTGFRETTLLSLNLFDFAISKPEF